MKTIKINELIKMYENDKSNIEELKTVWTSQKSFYKKAMVKDVMLDSAIIYNKNGIDTVFNDCNDGLILSILYSYNTLVTVIVYNLKNDTQFYLLNENVNGAYLLSNTTKRHITEFLKQNNFTMLNNKKMIVNNQYNLENNITKGSL